MTTTTPIHPGMNVHAIIQHVADATEIPHSVLIGRNRTRRTSLARFIAMAAIRQAKPHWPLQDIAESLCRDNHGTIIHGLKRYQHLYETDREFRRMADQCGVNA